MDVDGNVGFVSGASVHRAPDLTEPSQPTASTSKQATLGSFFATTQGEKREMRRREYVSATPKDCRRYVKDAVVQREIEHGN